MLLWDDLVFRDVVFEARKEQGGSFVQKLAKSCFGLRDAVCEVLTGFSDACDIQGAWQEGCIDRPVHEDENVAVLVNR